jgi:hypothetical protein
MSEKTFRTIYYLVHTWYRLEESEAAIVYVYICHHKNKFGQIVYSSIDKNNELDKLYKSEFSHFDDAKDYRRCFLHSTRPTVHIH